MSRVERPSRAESASETGQPRKSGGFDRMAEGGEIRFGCSMLSHIRLRPRNPAAFAMTRCALGYALKTREDIARCMAVEGPGECWKIAQNWRVAALDPKPGSAPATKPPVPASPNGPTPELAAAEPAPSERLIVAEVTIEQTVDVQVVEFVRLRGVARTDTGEPS